MFPLPFISYSRGSRLRRETSVRAKIRFEKFTRFSSWFPNALPKREGMPLKAFTAHKKMQFEQGKDYF